MSAITDTLTKGKAAAAKATEKANASVNDYTTLSGFKDYEVNSKGIVRKKSNGNIQMIPTGKKAYLLFDSSGKRRQLPNDVLTSTIQSIKAKPSQSIKVAKMIGEKKPKQKDKIIEQYNQYNDKDVDYKKIADALGVKENTVYTTIKIHRIKSNHDSGKTPHQIAEKTGIKLTSILWQLDKLKLTAHK